LARDDRLDLIRGYAMAVIAVTHLNHAFDSLGMRGRQFPVPGDYSFSSAAELFFLLSGYMVGMVYLDRGNLLSRSLRRAVEIYSINLLAFAAAIGIAWFSGSELAAATNANYTLSDPWRGVIEFLQMRQHPYLLGVLQIYVVLMLVTPLAGRLLNQSPYLLGAVSLSIYAVAQFYPELNLYGGDPDDMPRLWNFNPLAWQFPYCLGMLAGHARLHTQAFQWVSAARVRSLILLGIMFGLLILHRLHNYHFIEVPLIDKTNLGIIRMANTFATVGALVALLVLAGRCLRRQPFPLVSMLGRQTLYCYAASIPITYALAWMWLGAGRSYLAYGAALMALAVGLFAVAFIREKSARKHRARVAATT
jgi:hypothetical protein